MKKDTEVTVINDKKNPVPVKGIVKNVEPAIEPFQAVGSCTTNGSWCTSEDMFTVPTGKMAIVEYASASSTLPANNALAASVRTTLNSVEVAHGLFSSDVSSTKRSIHIGQQVCLYADAGTVIRMSGGPAGYDILRDKTIEFTISGRLVDLP